MTKKEILVIIASILLFIMLVSLMFFEMQHPEGGVEMLQTFLARILGK